MVIVEKQWDILYWKYRGIYKRIIHTYNVCISYNDFTSRCHWNDCKDSGKDSGKILKWPNFSAWAGGMEDERPNFSVGRIVHCNSARISWIPHYSGNWRHFGCLWWTTSIDWVSPLEIRYGVFFHGKIGQLLKVDFPTSQVWLLEGNANCWVIVPLYSHYIVYIYIHPIKQHLWSVYDWLPEGNVFSKNGSQSIGFLHRCHSRRELRILDGRSFRPELRGVSQQELFSKLSHKLYIYITKENHNFHGKSSIHGLFSMAMLVYQRVYLKRNTHILTWTPHASLLERMFPLALQLRITK